MGKKHPYKKNQRTQYQLVIKTKRIIKGTERTTLITEFKTKNTTLFSFIPPSLVRTSKNERISAKNEPIKRVNNSLIEYINRL